VLSTAQEARVWLAATDADLLEKVTASAEELKVLTQVAELTVADHKGSLEQPLAAQELSGLLVQVDKASGEKCVRCWFTLDSVGQSSQHAKICQRCLQVLEG
jgi:isoleucyl-tRNA synthetase